VLLGFVALALYFDSTPRSRLNIFCDECEGASQSADLYACRLAVYTRQLAIFTAVLAFATIVLIAIGIRQASALNRAAAAAERALTDVERPWLFWNGRASVGVVRTRLPKDNRMIGLLPSDFEISARCPLLLMTAFLKSKIKRLCHRDLTIITRHI
jgi:hypothetical protein